MTGLRSLPVVALVLIWASTSAPARADLLLATDFPSGSPLATIAGATSAPMTASVLDSTAGNAAVDNLTGFMVALQIVPQLGSTGTLSFSSPATGLAATPPNYVLAGIGSGLFADNTGNELFFTDINIPFTGGVDVPQSPGLNLLAFTFAASNDAFGLFDVVAIPGTANTLWTDNQQPSQLNRDFFNVPANGSPVVVGQVDVSAVPEPGAVWLVSAAMAIGSGLSWSVRRFNIGRR